MEPTTLLAIAALVVAGLAVASRSRTGSRRQGDGGREDAAGARAASATDAAHPVAPGTAPEPDRTAEPEAGSEATLEPGPEPGPELEPAVQLPVLPPRPAPAPTGSTTLGALAADHAAQLAVAHAADASRGDVPEPPPGTARLLRSLGDGGVLVVRGAAPAAAGELATWLLDAVGDRAIVRVTPPGRCDGDGGTTVVHAPLAARTPASAAASAADRTSAEGLPAVLVAALDRAPAGTVVLVERAQDHLRRGLDADAVAALRSARPDVLLVVLVGTLPAGGAADDAEAWLLWLGGGAVLGAGPDVDDRDDLLDEALAAVAERSAVAVDVIEAVAHAAAAGRLPEVPTRTVLRLAAGLAGGDVDAPVTPAALAEVLEAVAAVGADAVAPDGAVGADGRVLRCGGSGPDGLPSTLAVDPLLVARCVPGVAELPPALLAVLLEGEADDVELLRVARVVAGCDDPRPAVPVLDRLVEHATLGVEARLLRGVIRDRLGRPTAIDDYRTVADTAGVDAGLATHARFLAAGLLEAGGDLEGASAGYRAVVSTEHPVHAPMAAFNLAWLAERTGDLDAAADAYRGLASGGHVDAAPMAALNLGSLLQRGKRFAEAESWYRQAVDSRHHDAGPMAAVALGLMLERRQRPREARTLFRYAASSGHEEAAPAALRRLGAPHRAASMTDPTRGRR